MMTLWNMYSLNFSLKKLCNESLQWFNNLHNTNFSLTSPQIFLNLPTQTATNCNLEVVGVRENERARGRHARGVSLRVSPRVPVFSCANYFQAPATQANSNYISLSDKQIKDLRLLLLYVKQYHYNAKESYHIRLYIHVDYSA